MNTQHPFKLALSIVWRSPKQQLMLSGQALGLAMAWIPLASLLLGLSVALTAYLLKDLTAEVIAALLLIVWVKFSGGATLDSLARTTDIIFNTDMHNACDDKLKAQPLSAIGIALLVLTLILKWSLLVLVIASEWWPVLVLMPVVGWSFSQMVMLGSRWHASSNFPAGWRDYVALSWLWPQWLLLFMALALSSGWTLTVLIISTWAWIVWWRKHFGGIHEGVAYTWVEITEVVWLLGLVMVLSGA